MSDGAAEAAASGLQSPRRDHSPEIEIEKAAGRGGLGSTEVDHRGTPGREAEDVPGLDIERLLADALRPIEPPQSLTGRVEETLSAVTQAAADELSDWADELSESELAALRDPRNWVRPVVAVTAGGVATGALVLMEMRRRGRHRARHGLRHLRSRL